MNISYGVFNEAYKLVGRAKPLRDLKGAAHSMDLIAGQGDFAACSVLVTVDDAFSLHIGEYAWFTERGDVPTVRLCADFPIPVEAYHEQTHRAHVPTEYGDALLPVEDEELLDTLLEIFTILNEDEEDE